MKIFLIVVEMGFWQEVGFVVIFFFFQYAQKEAGAYLQHLVDSGMLSSASLTRKCYN